MSTSTEPSPPRARRTPILAAPLIGLVRVYQVLLSPLMGGRCRFVPTCSQYAIDALRNQGALKGSWLAARRILRCHPFGDSGYDPAPLPPEPRDSTPNR